MATRESRSGLPTLQKHWFIERGALSAYCFTCGQCGREWWVPRSGTATFRSTDTDRLNAMNCERALAAARWTHKSGFSRMRCDECSQSDAKTKTRGLKMPEQTATVVPMTPSAQAPQAAVARKPTQAERRRVSDALEERYDTAAGRYRGTTTDASLAADLNVPRLWVEEVRVLLFGDGHGNEAMSAAGAGLATLKKQMDAHEAKVLAHLDAFRTELARLERMIGGG